MVDAAEAVAISIEEELKRAADKVEDDLAKIETKIHRFPRSMLGLVNDGLYVVPNLVAIGPYHHGAHHVQKAEELKRAAVHYFCRDSGHSAEAVYMKILSVAGNARSCYVDDAVTGISDADFATMMLHDGCFLLQFIMWYTEDEVAPSLESLFGSITDLPRDIFLLENQIPWLVLQALIDLRPVLVSKFIAKIGSTFCIVYNLEEEFNFPLDKSFTWPHLLGLLRCYITGNMTNNADELQYPEGVTSFSVTSSAIELRKIGIKLTASRTTDLRDMGIKKGTLFANLFLAPFMMNYNHTCWIVNMIALETCIQKGLDNANNTVVMSYIIILAMLMNREEDVHELRAKGLVQGKFSDQETLQFIKALVKHAYIGPHYLRILGELEAYKRKRWLWIIVHKFVYNNIKTIITLLSVIGVLVGVFKTLLSINQHKQ